jgi:hypothetical protein
VGILAVVLVLPSLGAGFIADDFGMRLTMLDSPTTREVFATTPLDLFRFFDGNPERVRRGMDLGFLPWWTHEEIKGAFWRPVASLTHIIDYALWPDSPAMMHAQSIVWYGLLVMAAALFYRRIMGLTVAAGLAAILFAVDDAHGLPAGWLANRNAILAAFFGVLALVAHDRWRRDGSRAAALLAPLLLLISLLSAEAGIAVCGYLTAYALFLDRDTLMKRALSFAPAAAVVVVWRIVWTLQGYGFAHMGLYVDPLGTPGPYLSALVERAPILLLGQWAAPPADLAVMFSPSQMKILWRFAVAFLCLLAAVLWSLLRRDRAARFWATGMLLSILPAAATFPSDRLLVFAGLGAMGLLGRFLVLAFGSAPERPKLVLWRVPAVVLASLFVFLHLVVSPPFLLFRSGQPMGMKRIVDQFYVRTPLGPEVTDQDLIIVNPPISLLVAYFPLVREAEGLPVPRRMRILAPGIRWVEITRRDENTLRIRPDRGYLSQPYDVLFRSLQDPMRLGQRVSITGMTVEITEISRYGRPAEAEFTFEVPLEDPSLRWLQWEGGDFVPFTPPDAGETVVLEVFTSL